MRKGCRLLGYYKGNRHRELYSDIIIRTHCQKGYVRIRYFYNVMRLETYLRTHLSTCTPSLDDYRVCSIYTGFSVYYYYIQLLNVSRPAPRAIRSVDFFQIKVI